MSWTVLSRCRGARQPREDIYNREIPVNSQTGPENTEQAEQARSCAEARHLAVFDNAVAPMGATFPSHASMLTGLYPRQHRVRANHDNLDASTDTLAERLGAAGYDTAAFVSFGSMLSRGGLHQGFEVLSDAVTGTSTGDIRDGEEVTRLAVDWLGATRLQVAAMCLGRAHRALELAIDWAVDRKQFGQPIGRFQGVGFKIAEMRMRLEAAELLTLKSAWKTDQGSATDSDYAMAKLYTTEMLAYVADEAIQIHGGMGLMADLPLERIWRDARVERIWEGTSEIQRHIISRDILRPRWD